MKNTIHYINTDLELVSAVDLAPLLDALASRGLFQLHLYQHEALWHASFETDEQFDSPEPNIAAFLAIVESLDSASQNLWSTCMSRAFDLGFRYGDEPFSFCSQITVPTLARVVAVAASLHLTLYQSGDDKALHYEAEPSGA